MWRANVLIVVGTVIIAAGGIMATYGWGLRATKDTRGELQRSKEQDALDRENRYLQALTAEPTLNNQMLANPKFHETDEGALGQYVIFPRFQLVALGGAIAGGSFAKAQDDSFYKTIVYLHQILLTANQNLDRLEFGMQRQQSNIAILRRGLGASKWFTDLRDSLTVFGQLLDKEQADLGTLQTR